MEEEMQKSSARLRADEIKPYRCKNLIAVIEDPIDIKNIGTIIRNVNALGIEKAYIIDPRRALPDDWQDMREQKFSGSSVTNRGASATSPCCTAKCASAFPRLA